MNTIKSKRFVVRKSLIGTNTVIEFTNKKGNTYTSVSASLHTGGNSSLYIYRHTRVMTLR